MFPDEVYSRVQARFQALTPQQQRNVWRRMYIKAFVSRHYRVMFMDSCIDLELAGTPLPPGCPDYPITQRDIPRQAVPCLPEEKAIPAPHWDVEHVPLRQ